MSLLDAANLEISFHIHKEVFRVAGRIDLTLEKGETLVIAGESGCGKSAFAMSVAGILPPNARVGGSIRYRGMELVGLDQKKLRSLRGEQIGFIPQSSSTCLNPVLRIETQFAHVLKRSSSKVRHGEAIARIFDELGLERRVARMYPHQLSEGMKGRVLAGLGVCLKPTLVIADEPTKGLDDHAKEGVMAMFSRILSENNRSLIMITHDFDAAAALPGRLAIMYAGEFVEWGPTASLIGKKPRHPYTIGLLASLPNRDFRPMPGRCAGIRNLQKGCRFANRCPKATPICHKIHPHLEQVSQDHWARCLNA